MMKGVLDDSKQKSFEKILKSIKDELGILEKNQKRFEELGFIDFELKKIHKAFEFWTDIIVESGEIFYTKMTELLNRIEYDELDELKNPYLGENGELKESDLLSQ